jgi:DNA-binding transcriptional LysR family regulator
VIAACHTAGLSPSLVEVPDVEQALLAVAAGAGLALLPEPVAAHYAAPGVRFVPLAQPAPGFQSGVVTRRDGEHEPTAAFLRALARGAEAPAPAAPAPAAPASAPRTSAAPLAVAAG